MPVTARRPTCGELLRHRPDASPGRADQRRVFNDANHCVAEGPFDFWGPPRREIRGDPTLNKRRPTTKAAITAASAKKTTDASRSNPFTSINVPTFSPPMMTVMTTTRSTPSSWPHGSASVWCGWRSAVNAVTAHRSTLGSDRISFGIAAAKLKSGSTNGATGQLPNIALHDASERPPPGLRTPVTTNAESDPMETFVQYHPQLPHAMPRNRPRANRATSTTNSIGTISSASA